MIISGAGQALRPATGCAILPGAALRHDKSPVEIWAYFRQTAAMAHALHRRRSHLTAAHSSSRDDGSVNMLAVALKEYWALRRTICAARYCSACPGYHRPDAGRCHDPATRHPMSQAPQVGSALQPRLSTLKESLW